VSERRSPDRPSGRGPVQATLLAAQAPPGRIAIDQSGKKKRAIALTGPMDVEIGQSLPKSATRATSGFPPLATELQTSLVVRFVPNSEVAALTQSGLTHR
jgi:hypothetical protein